MAGAMYGFLLGIVLSVLHQWDSPIAWASYWAVETILLTTFARLVWRRTGLLLMTLAAVHGALVSAAFVPASLFGFTLWNLPSPWAGIFWANALGIPIWLVAERLAYPREWRRWKQHMEPMSLRDVLMFRHIPYLRQR